jgi:dihydroxy-acid dehydratase
MGTASTMTAMAEALGTTLTGAAAIPAADSRRRALAHLSGRRIVQLVRDDVRLSQILTPAAFHNAIATLNALGGSTNAVIHLPAIAGRLGIDLPLERFDELSRTVPFIANLKPSGDYLMEEFHQAGGVPAVMAEIRDSLELGALTVTGRTMGENLASRTGGDGRVIRTRSAPLSPDGGIVILRGTLAPGSAVIKRSAASERLLRHRGRAYVFESRVELLEHIDDDDLPVDADTVLVLKHGGPKGGPGMPEWGQLPIPGKLLRQGVTDMLRISDARMSGTSYGTVVLHTSPEAAAGGPLAVVQTGDEIELDVDERRLDLLVSAEELARRLAAWEPPVRHYTRGYGRLFVEHVLGVEAGCDFDFLRADGAEQPDYGRLYARMGHS